jgi:hypothetical protein
MEQKKRHECVTAWLIFMIVANSVAAISNLLLSDTIAAQLKVESPAIIMVLGIVSLFNLLCAIQILKWKKWGFWGFLASAVVTFIINISLGLPITNALLGLIGFGILYAILQIKTNDKSAWEQLG